MEEEKEPVMIKWLGPASQAKKNQVLALPSVGEYSISARFGGKILLLQLAPN